MLGLALMECESALLEPKLLLWLLVGMADTSPCSRRAAAMAA